MNLLKAIFFFPKASFRPICTKKADFHGSAFSFAKQRYNMSEQIPNRGCPLLDSIVRKRTNVNKFNAVVRKFDCPKSRMSFFPFNLSPLNFY